MKGPAKKYLAIDDLVTSLSRFSSLQVVSLLGTFQHLDFGDQMSGEVSGDGDNIYPRRTRAQDRKTQTGAAETEAAMIRYTSRIARRILSIEAFFINEHADGQVGADGWNIQGWLNAAELRSVDHREMVGTLEFMPRTSNPRFNTERYRSQRHWNTTFYV
ncbi:hypothetical protein BT96DRAFT_503863 [Gymnopus androsaceus JB14]|uniref:Uncharacterized protein n=1 Tax=Gymnopus androsaceus JB14 TaxID=1447944 RepID=A0A6A4I1I9_9AGAR|nr:hypothetical protein BT96DRAFT_503863 [Gymnopus androsaceus JB14]